MALEVTQKYVAPSRLPFVNLRWSAVFAGLAVGISANLFLLLVGGAAGLAMFTTEARPSGEGIAMAAALWNTLCMLIGAFVGGYVAARASGMRRSRDGILHGAVCWGMTMLLSAILAGSAAGSALSGMFSAISSEPGAAASVARSAQTGDRQSAVSTLQSQLGLTEEQASRLYDQAQVLAGREQGGAQMQEETREGMRTASMASGWLSGAILLSLLAAMGGGMLGARATRRLGGPELRRVVTQRTDGDVPIEGAPPV
jgi:hypothetical protein